jgi:RND family efflux transporter MFP subunit
VAEERFRSAQFAVEKSQKDLEAAKERAAATEQQKQTDLDNALFVAETATRRIGNEGRGARARTAALKGQLEAVQRQLESCIIRAPSSGLLVLVAGWRGNNERRAPRVGDQLWPRSQLAEIPDLSRMQVGCKVPERDIGNVRPGQEVLITLEELPEKRYHGKVARIGAMAELLGPEDTSGLEPGTRVFNVTVDLAEKDPAHLVPGMTATAEFVTRRLRDVVYVNKESVFEEGEAHVVYLLRGNQIVATPVTLGPENAEFVEVRKGLRPGQQIAKQRPITPEEAGL